MITSLRKYILFCIFFSLSIHNSYSFTTSRAKDALGNNNASAKKWYKPERVFGQKKAQTQKVRTPTVQEIKEFWNEHEMDKYIAQQEKDSENHQKRAEDGTDLALKRLAAEFEKQWMQIMFSFTYGDEGSFASKHWQREFNDNIVASGVDVVELGEIGLSIYEELKQIESNNKKNGTNK